MRIEKTIPATPPASQIQATRASADAQPNQPVPPVRKSDHVRISDAGQAMAEATSPVKQDFDAPLTPAQITGIRQRLASGAYDSPQFLDATARRILASGDLNALRAFEPEE